MINFKAKPTKLISLMNNTKHNYTDGTTHINY